MFSIGGMSQVNVGLVFFLQNGTGVDCDGLLQRDHFIRDENTAPVETNMIRVRMYV